MVKVMKESFFYILLLLVIALNYSCNTVSAEQVENNIDLADCRRSDLIKIGTRSLIFAKFIAFEFGIAPHYKFEDAEGKIWDFGGCETKNIEFIKALPTDKQNEQNQGWASNTALIWKWFYLKYVIRAQYHYEGGPIADVPIIVSAKAFSE